MSATVKHPAKYSADLLPVFEDMLKGCTRVLDPFAGTGKIHLLPFKTVGLELEPEWANLHPDTIVGDATNLPFSNEEFDGICTSPTYGNRMADSHEANDGSSRNTYTHKLGRKLNDNNTGKMQWGESYRNTHKKSWSECYRVLKPNGVFVLNFKNHIRNKKLVDVFSFHIKTLIELGFMIDEVRQVKLKGNGFGQNRELRTGYEYVAKLIKI